MTYKMLLKKIAEKHNTTPSEVEKEMHNAIKISGYDVPPEEFISLIAGKIKREMNDNT